MTLQSYGSLYGLACNPYHTSTGYNTNCDAAIVDWNSIWAPQYTFAHEVGHLFGGRHEISPNNDPTSCAHGYLFTTGGGEDRTIMESFNSNVQPSSTPILYFSDPNNTYNGFTLGTASANNTILIQNIICENTSFRGEQGSDPAFRQDFDYKNTTQNAIFPNPTQDNIYISSKEEFEAIELISVDGKVLNSVFFPNRQNYGDLDISQLPKGMYFLKLKFAHSFEVKKFLKK